MQNHLNYMKEALTLAERGKATVSPNPMVGCVIVKDQKVIGRGYHQKAGENHAEVNAICDTNYNCRDSTLYVTLEPCCHHGRTPPCIDAIIAANISKVVIATLDPNPLVAGKGVRALQAAGIEVEVGCMQNEAEKLNEVFFHYITTKRPFVIAKWAMSLDGKTIAHPDDDRQISGENAEIHTHTLRHHVDAVMIGANTARSDDPLLTVRAIHSIKQPARIIISKNLDLPIDLKLLNTLDVAKTILVTSNKVDVDKIQAYLNRGVDIIQLNCNEDNDINLNDLLIELGKREITSILVEGGMHLLSQFFAANLVNQTHVYIAPTFIGNLNKKLQMPDTLINKLGNDLHLLTEFEGKSHV